MSFASSQLQTPKPEKILNSLVIVAALGYFVDIYDLVLFGMERVASLRDILAHQLPAEEQKNINKYIADIGQNLLNWQMFGMLVGGVAWGIIGDKKGRLSVLFGSIITYSIANILNGMVTDTHTYAVLRFVSGFGLAGELGAGITLVSETLSAEKRGYGATIVASVGLFGAVVAGLTALMLANWRLSYFIGGGLGVLLLLMRIGVSESEMFKKITQEKESKKGNFFMLFKSRKILMKYLNVILIAVPVWYVMSLLIQFSPEMLNSLGVTYKFDAQNLPRYALMIAYSGITLGDVFSGLLSQRLKSRKKALTFFLGMTLFCVVLYFFVVPLSLTAFYIVCFLIGFSTGYWAVFMCSASELFGTNIRSTVTTSAPNFVRGATILITMASKSLSEGIFRDSGHEKVKAAIVVGIIVFLLAFYALYKLEETYGKELSYTEHE